MYISPLKFLSFMSYSKPRSLTFSPLCQTLFSSPSPAPCLAKILADPAFEDFKEQLTIVAFDDFPETLQAIRDGYVLATMVQRPKQMGIYVIESLYDLNTGGSAESVDTGITVVTVDNIDTYKGGKKED